MEPIWKKHWPTTVDEASIRLPDELLPATLARQAKRVPERTAIQFYGRVITFAELDVAVGRLAGFLKARGVQAGDRVAIFLENSPLVRFIEALPKTATGKVLERVLRDQAAALKGE